MSEKPENSTSDQPARSAKLKTNLVALGSAAVFSVYAAGFERTETAARRFANEGDDRLPPPPGAHTGVIHAPSPAAIAAPATASTPHESAQASRKVAPNVAAETEAATRAEPSKPERTAHQSVDTAKAAPKTVAAAPAPVVASAPAATPSTAPMATAAPSAPSAPASTSAPTSAKSDSANQTTPDTGAVRYKDGTYTGWGTSRHGDIQATVIVKSGRITFAGISECLTQYSCSWISALPPQVIQRQSAEVDYVSGATQSTRAFYYAVLEALAKAK